MRRFLSHHFSDLLAAAGVPPLKFGDWNIPGIGWAALNLPRRFVFEDEKDGDVDFLAGPLEPAFSPDDVVARHKEMVDEFGEGGHLINLAWQELLATHGVVWPPRERNVVAVEVKASWFSMDAHQSATPGALHAPQNGWKATHRQERRRITGQLNYLAESGIQHVSLLHLAATRPRAHSVGHPWLEAAHDAAVAEDHMAQIFHPADTGYGYFTSVVGAVPHKTENLAGAGGGLRVHHQPDELAGTAGGWLSRLWDKLRTLPAPRSASPIAAFGDCGLRWEAATAWGLGVTSEDAIT